MNFDNGRTLYWLFQLKLPQEDGTFGGNRNSSWSRIWGQHPWGGRRSKCACLCWHLLVGSNISSKCSSPQTTKVFSLMDAMILRVLHFSVWILTMMIVPKAPGIWGGGNTFFISVSSLNWLQVESIYIWAILSFSHLTCFLQQMFLFYTHVKHYQFLDFPGKNLLNASTKELIVCECSWEMRS